MKLDARTEKRLYNRCDPAEPLFPHDERRVSIPAEARGIDWVERLSRAFTLADKPTVRLFSGLPGTGKTTELRRLKERLENDSDMLVVSVDAENDLELDKPVQQADLLTIMAMRAVETVVTAEGGEIDSLWSGGFLARVAKLFSSDLEPQKVEVGTTTLGKILFDIKTVPDARDRIRQWFKQERQVFRRELNQLFTDLQQRAITAGKQGLVVLVDSMEKLEVFPTDFEDVLKSAEILFSRGSADLRLPVSVLYTTPPALLFRLSESIDFMPMLKLRDQHGRRWEPGYAAARSLVRARIADNELEAIFGAEKEARVDTIIAASGGHPREIVQVLRSCIEAGNFPLSEHAVRRVLLEAAQTYTNIALGNGAVALQLLAKVHVLQEVVSDPSDHVLVDRLFSNNLILRYQNDKTWYAIHPSIPDIDLVARAIEQVRQQVTDGTLLSFPSGHEEH